MSQAPSVTSPSPTYRQLQNALGSLELDLEAELRRYRRHRSAEVPEQHQWRNPMAWQDTPQASVEVEAVPSEPVTPTGGDRYAAVSLPTPESPANRSPEMDRVLDLLQQSATEKAMGQGLLNLEDQQVPPEDYLESSEELLKSLEPDAPAPTSKPPQRLTWTPKQWGFVGVAIAGCVILGAVILPKLFKSETPQTTTAVQPTSDLLSTPSSPSAGTEPKTVNLASQEFVNLSLDNLSVVDPTTTPVSKPPATTATAAPTTATPQPTNPAIAPPLANPTGRDNLAAALLPPSLRPQPAPAFPVTPQIAASQPAASGETLMTPDGLKVGYYYVIYRNTSPRSLGKARELVQDAFVRTFPVGRAVQMAEVQDVTKANALVQKFNEAKIAAELYHHQLSPVSQR